ncbi:MAG TPA: prepilin-type N-terminal cleavage/methylation domain-containing protein [Candidatus Paceibacterota bacterium]|nr:MAG: hypothetical protein A3B44_02145 [Candidatus Levybacteria bacterium RIFCSPLOWO2_01_FULL_38_21]
MNQELRIRNKKFRIKSIIRNSLFIIRKSDGFTLIELLIVIAIIGVLATILLANFIGVRQRSRDAQRKADLRQIQSAIELYKADQGVYPTPLYSTDCPTSSPLVGGTVTYVAKIPCDPSGISYWNSGNYYYSLNGTAYTLGACIENANDADPQITLTSPSGSSVNCPSSPSKYYVLTNP